MDQNIVEKHAYGIDPETATREDLSEYVNAKILTYTQCEFKGYDLWAIFQEDFTGWTDETFKKVRTDTRTRLRTYLVSGGVFVESYSNRRSLGTVLLDVLEREEFRGQTEAETTAARLLPDKTSTVGKLDIDPIVKPETGTYPTTIPDPELLRSRDLRSSTAPVPTSGLNLYHKEVTTLAKMYTDEQRYDGINDSFDYKLAIFYDVCDRIGLPPAGYARAFPTMLKGMAQDHYYNSRLSQRTFEEACTHIRGFFEGPEFYRRNLTTWNATSYKDVIASHPDKSLLANFQLMVDLLLKQRHGLHPDFRSDRFLTNKIITACQGIPACRIAISRPVDDLAAMINQVQSSIVAWETEHPNTTSQTFFTDRRYQQRRDARDTPRRAPQAQEPTQYRGSGRPRPKCYVCNKEDCRSWKHTEAERQRAKDQYRSRFAARHPTAPGNFNDRFAQYASHCEGEPDNETYDDFDQFMTDSLPISDVEEGNADDSDEAFFTTAGTLSPEDASAATTSLMNAACYHTLDGVPSWATDDSPDPFTYHTTAPRTRYNATTFMGIMVDTGASTRSTAGFGQFQALAAVDPSVSLDSTRKGQVVVQFGIGSTSSVGTTDVTTPIGTVRFHVVHADTPFLLSLADMDRLKVYYNNLKNVVVTANGQVPVTRRFGHPFILWGSGLQSFITSSFTSNPCTLTDVELRRLHRRFGHPSVARLHRVLHQSGHVVDMSAIEQLTKFCHYCQKYGQSPGRFRFTLRDDVAFNYNIIVDVMYISGSPLLHVVDEATRFQTGRWLQDISAKHTWDTLRMCWIDTYLGPPDFITHDAGKNFVSREFQEYASSMGTKTKAVPVEAHHSVGMVERYHGPLRRAYQIIVTEIPGINRDMGLQMAFKALNDSAGPRGLVPTLLVFGAYPRMVEGDPPSPSVAQRTAAIRKAMAVLSKLRAERQVADALQTRNGPSTEAVHDLPPNSPVLVWREGGTGRPGHWDGPFPLLTIEGETARVQLSSGVTAFRSTSLKPYLRDDTETSPPVTELAPDPTATPQEEQHLPLPAPPVREAQAPAKRGRGRPRKYPILTATCDVFASVPGPSPDVQFRNSRHKELTGLLTQGVFEVVQLTDIPAGTRLFRSRFVDEVKHAGTEQAYEKSRLVVQAYDDSGKEQVLTQSPTIQRVSQRLLLCVAVLKGDDTRVHVRDITQAYVQSSTRLNRDFYVRPPRELVELLDLNETSALKVVKPLYGVPEAGNHWYRTYHSHHTDRLHLTASTYDPCLLHSATPFAVVGLQTDDTLFVCDTAFAEKEGAALASAAFMAKDRETLSVDTPIKFNGGLITLAQDGSIRLNQERHCSNLSPVSATPATTVSSRGVKREQHTLKEQYVAQRARGAYIASVCQPESAFDLSFAAQVTAPTEDDAKFLNRRLEWQSANATRGLTFVKLDTDTLQLLVFTDASFANNKDLSSQIGYVVVLADGRNRANILHWSSVKCKRVTRSVLASELYAMTHGYDIGASIKASLDAILLTTVPLIMCTDSKSLYDCLVRLGTTQEKRLMIDVMALRQAYERRQIAEVKWVEGGANPADAMTKAKPCIALQKIIDSNHIDLQAIGWVERKDVPKGRVVKSVEGENGVKE